MKKMSKLLALSFFLALMTLVMLDQPGRAADADNGQYYVFDQSGVLSTGGWVKSGGFWYYANPDGTAVTGWKKISGKWYYFNPDPDPSYYGSMVTGSNAIDGKIYIFDQSGALSTGGWVKEISYAGDKWYYTNADGTAITGWKTIGGKKYYFDPNHTEMAAGPYEIDGKLYAFDQSGALSTGGWVKLKSSSGRVYWFYANPDGTCFTGWKKISGHWYYFDPNDWGVRMATGAKVIDDKVYIFHQDGTLSDGGWVKKFSYYSHRKEGEESVTYSYINDGWYYTNADGTAVTGWKSINGKRYYFKTEGSIWFDYVVMADGPETIDGKRYVFDKNGVLSSGGWVQASYLNGNGKWYYANTDGTAVTGWKKISGKWYYFEDDPDAYYYGSMVTGSKAIDGKIYVFDKNGILSTGGWEEGFNIYYNLETMVYLHNNWYYTNTDGTAVTGWKKISGNWYYFNPVSDPDSNNYRGGAMLIGPHEIDGKLYVFDQNGVLSTGGWVKDSSSYDRTYWYYTNPDGTAITGWKTIGGKRYYFDTDLYSSSYGRMITGSYLIDRKQYVFDQNGVLSAGGWTRNPYGEWYYANPDGTVITGWKTIGGKRYYFNPNFSGEMVTGLIRIE